MTKSLLAALLLLAIGLVQAQSAKEILEKSINYHDPNGEWSTLKATFTFRETRLDGPDRKTIFQLDNSRNWHQLNRNNEEIYEVSGADVKVVKGDKGEDRGKMLRNYYLYLWGLPMKLKDQGTALNDKVEKKTIEKWSCYALTVEYEKETWTFYIDQKTFAMRAYGFKQKDGSNQEEYIALEGEIKVGSLTLPKARSWYDMPGRKFLGTDILEKTD